MQASAGKNITDSAQIAVGIVESTDIKDNDIAAVDIATDAIETAEIKDGAIVNADINASAAIVDTKLATISTAGKVDGAALTGLANIPGGAGKIPAANLTASGPIAKNLATITISASSTETDIIANTSIPGGTLTTGNAILVRCHWRVVPANTNGDITFRLYYGGSVVHSRDIENTSETQYGTIEFIMAYNGASAQYISVAGGGEALREGTADSGFFATGAATSAIDSSTAQNLRFTVQSSAANTPTTVNIYGATATII